MTGAPTEVRFYHLAHWPLETALPRLLVQAHAKGVRTVVRIGTQARLDALNNALWTFDPGSFLPHGGPGDGEAARQPIYLTTDDDIPNDATLMILVDGATADDIDRFERCFDMFDGDEQSVAAARDRWKAHTEAGRPVTYWQQSPDGKWEQKA